MKIVTLAKNAGMAFQGDVLIAPLPDGVNITSADEMPLELGTLVVARGEATGHNHAFRYGLQGAALFRDDGLARDLESRAGVGAVRLFRDPAALDALVKNGLVTDRSLCIGFLRVEPGVPPLTHEEHDAIQLPPGEYYVSRKREFRAGLQSWVFE